MSGADAQNNAANLRALAERESVSLGDMVASYVKHIDEHLVYILEKRKRLGK